MKQPFNALTKNDIEFLRKKRSCIPTGANNVVYNHTISDILSSQAHLESLYHGRITLPFAERILLLNDIY